MLTGKKGRLSSEQAEAIKRDLQVPFVSMVDNTMRIKNEQKCLKYKHLGNNNTVQGNRSIERQTPAFDLS